MTALVVRIRRKRNWQLACLVVICQDFMHIEVVVYSQRDIEVTGKINSFITLITITTIYYDYLLLYADKTLNKKRMIPRRVESRTRFIENLKYPNK